MPAEVAQTVRRALARVVEGGTAGASRRRVQGRRRATAHHRRQDRHRRSPLRTLRQGRATARIARGQPHRHLRVLSGRPLLRHPDGAGAGRAGRPVRLHQLAHRADPENPAAAIAAAPVSAPPANPPSLCLRPKPARSPNPCRAEPAPVAPRAPVKEKPDGSTSQADPPVKQPAPTQGGFPEDLEPSVVLPVPVAPPETAPAPPAAVPTP